MAEIQYLSRQGRKTAKLRQEVVLLSDLWGSRN